MRRFGPMRRKLSRRIIMHEATRKDRPTRIGSVRSILKIHAKCGRLPPDD